MSKTYRICRAEEGDALIDLRSMLRSVFGFGRLAAAPVRRRSLQHEGAFSFDAIADGRIVGSMTLLRPDHPTRGDSDWHVGAATLARLYAEPGHEDGGCREALLDVAVQWASANDCSALETQVPAVPAQGVDFYLASGFHILGQAHESGSDVPLIVLSLDFSEARSYSDAWYSKHHGAWFASAARRA